MKLTQVALSRKWGTSQKNVSLMIGKGCDFDAPDEDVAKWLMKHAQRKSKAMREAIASVLKPERVPRPEGEEVRSLEEMRDYYSGELDAATKADTVEREDVKFWNDLLLKADESIRRSEAHAKKLGVDRGELLGRSEVERILRAMFWAGNACCDKFAKQLAQKLSNKSPAEVYEILAPQLTSLTIFEGMKKVAKCPGDVNLPEWVIDCTKTEETQYLD